MAQRSIGVTIGGILLLLQSTCVSSAMALWIHHWDTFWGIFAILTLVAAIGLLCLQWWARGLVLGMSSLGLLVGGLGLLGLVFAPFFNSRDVPVRVYIGSGLIDGGWLVLSIWWLYLLTKPSIQEQFSMPQKVPRGLTHSRAPLAIKLIGIWLCASVLRLSALGTATSASSWVLGFSTPVWFYQGYQVLNILISVYLGVVLWQLKPLAWKLTIGYFIFNIIEALLGLRIPKDAALAILTTQGFSAESTADLERWLTSPWYFRLAVAAIVPYFLIWLITVKRTAFYLEPDSAVAHDV